MAFNPIQFLEFSKKMFDDEILNDLETITRVIISRAYYSAFLHAKEYLKENEGIYFTEDRSDHKMVENLLMLNVNRLLGSSLRELCENRETADYILDNPAIVRTRRGGAMRVLTFDKNAQTDCISLAEMIISQLPRT